MSNDFNYFNNLYNNAMFLKSEKWRVSLRIPNAFSRSLILGMLIWPPYQSNMLKQVPLEKILNFDKLYIFSLLHYNLAPLGKAQGPSREQNRISFTQGCFVLSLVEISPVCLEKILKFLKCIFAIISLHFNELESFTEECIVSCLVEISPIVLRKNIF